MFVCFQSVTVIVHSWTWTYPRAKERSGVTSEEPVSPLWKTTILSHL